MSEVKIIFGPPGTGKTTRLMDILEDELSCHHPSEIAYVSFTREGANQGKNRALTRFTVYKEADFKYFRTLHSMAFQALGLKRTGVMNYKHYKFFSKKMGMRFLGYYTPDLVSGDDKYLFFDELHRNNPKAAADYLPDLNIDVLKFVRHNFRRFKDTFALLDYTDMINEFNKKNEPIPVKIAFVDEAQDLTTLQWRMVWTAFRHCDRIYIAGDDDQAIYQWSGADVEAFLQVTGDIEILTKSYRLPDAVLEFAKNTAKHISRRVEKDYHGTGVQGSVSFVNGIDEIDIDPNQTYMFLSRNNIFLNAIEAELRKKRVVYARDKIPSITQKDVHTINLYEKVRETRIASNDDMYNMLWALKEGYNFKNPWYESFNWPQDKIDYVRDLVQKKVKIRDPKIFVGTIHSVKGAEADNVVVLLDVTRSVMLNIDKHPDTENRVFYVAFTRAKKNLILVNSNSKYSYKL